LAVDEDSAAQDLIQPRRPDGQKHAADGQEGDDGEGRENGGLQVKSGPEHSRVAQRLEPERIDVVRDQCAAGERDYGERGEQRKADATPARGRPIVANLWAGVRGADPDVNLSTLARFVRWRQQEEEAVSPLFSPLELRGLKLRNRIVVSPMCQYSADVGAATAWHLMHAGSLSVFGAAVFCFEATAVEADGRITPGCLGLCDERTESALRPVMAAMRKYSQIAVMMQLAHAGRKASCHIPWEGGQLIPTAQGGWRPSAPSALAFKESDPAPLALDAAGLARVRTAFVEAARRAMRLGIDGIEIHAAHGYLLHEFLSPLANRRTDDYGGSLANRMRLTLEVFDAVRAAVPADKPVGVRVSCTDWVDGGWDLGQTIVLARELGRRGVDWIDASSGGLSPLQKIPLVPGYQVPFAQAIKAAAAVNTIAVGLITEARQAEAIIASGKADLVALARAMLYDPRWPWHAAAQLGATVQAPPQYWRSQPSDQKGLFGAI
jgi:NADPH2 dehydrogenase